MDAPEYVLALSCADRPGIVHAVSGFLVSRHCTITASQQFGDPTTGLFFMRVQLISLTDESADTLAQGFAMVAAALAMTWSLSPMAARQRVLVLVSTAGHCLNDLLFRMSTGSLGIDIPAIVSNHTDLAPMAATFGVPFHHMPVTEGTKVAAEGQLLALVHEQHIDLVVLARYMQVLSDSTCQALAGRAINIHHSFLPSFKGAQPYHQAYRRGVKLIGATAHYVTVDLDEGPIIEQEVERVGHELGPGELSALGRDLECRALARAVAWHTEHRIFVAGQRTVVFRRG